MTRKTKADKIAAKLRVLKQEKSSGSNSSQINTISNVTVFHTEDAFKTFATTVFVLAVIALIYVLQARGFII